MEKFQNLNFKKPVILKVAHDYENQTFVQFQNLKIDLQTWFSNFPKISNHSTLTIFLFQTFF
jgi:hypothetical protein